VSERPASSPPVASEGARVEARVRALEALLVEKGYVDPGALDALVETYEFRVGPRNGAAVVARAWTDPQFRTRLFAEPRATLASMGFTGRAGEVVVPLENLPGLHNVVVCTLCSCYPWPLLGLPPAWYKSAAYRSRVVADPRSVLRDFGLELPADTEIRVWDSTSEVRYFVLPLRPEGTEGWPADRLADLVTRDSMIGTGVVPTPGPAG
jgi:nitrile hydratase subunit alpha